jgi:hypothetical protein
MTALHGDKIESLLWENGFEFQHRHSHEGLSEFEIFADTSSIVLAETWSEDGNWFLDADWISYERVQGGDVFDMGYLESVADERGLVDLIVEMGEQ